MVCLPTLQQIVLLGRWPCSKHQAVNQRPSLFPSSGSTITNIQLSGPLSSFLHQSSRREKNMMKYLLSGIFMSQALKCYKPFPLTFHWPEPITWLYPTASESGKHNLSLCKERKKENSLDELPACFCLHSFLFSRSEPIDYETSGNFICKKWG